MTTTPETPSLRSILGQLTLRRSTSTTVNLGLYTLIGGSTAADIATRDVLNEWVAALDTIGGEADQTATTTAYSNATSGMAATTVQAAIDEVAGGTALQPSVSTSTGPMPGASGTKYANTSRTFAATNTAVSFAIADLRAVKMKVSVLATKVGAAYSIDYTYVVRRDGGTVTAVLDAPADESSAGGPRVAPVIVGTTVNFNWTAVDGTTWKLLIRSEVSELPDA